MQNLTYVTDELAMAVPLSKSDLKTGTCEYRVLKSMPVDPTSPDWTLNRQHDDGESLDAPTESHADRQNGRLGRLEQIVAALTYLVLDDSGSPELAELADLLAGWAANTVSVDALSDDLAEFVSLAPCTKVRETAQQPTEQQQVLFSDAEAE